MQVKKTSLNKCIYGHIVLFGNRLETVEQPCIWDKLASISLERLSLRGLLMTFLLSQCWDRSALRPTVKSASFIVACLLAPAERRATDVIRRWSGGNGIALQMKKMSWWSPGVCLLRLQQPLSVLQLLVGLLLPLNNEAGTKLYFHLVSLLPWRMSWSGPVSEEVLPFVVFCQGRTPPALCPSPWSLSTAWIMKLTCDYLRVPARVYILHDCRWRWRRSVGRSVVADLAAISGRLKSTHRQPTPDAWEQARLYVGWSVCRTWPTTDQPSDWPLWFIIDEVQRVDSAVASSMRLHTLNDSLLR